MPLITIPQTLEDMNKSEKYVMNKLKTLYLSQKDIVYLYLEPKIKRLTPDFLLIDPERGVVIIEVKAWDIDYIDKINFKEVINKQNETLENPAYKARRYFNTTQGLFKFHENLLDRDGNLKFNLHSILILPELSKEDAKKYKIEEYLDYYPVRVLYKEDIRSISFAKLFNNNYKKIDENIVDNIKVAIFPEIKIVQTKDEDSSIDEQIKALDYEQDRFAKSLPFGHYMITGIPGSGKTIVLLARALYISKLYPDWKILILTYNKALSSVLKHKLDKIKEEFEYHDIEINNIQIMTFHSLAMKYSNLSPRDFPFEKQNEFWNEILPKSAAKNAKPYYDMILIDEYQDFYKEWFELVIKLLNKHKDKNKEYINLFLAGDRLQSIYNPSDINWKQDIGLDMRGRSKLLQSSYRVTKEHINLGLSILRRDNKYKKEVEKFYDDGKDLELKNLTKNSIKLIQGDYYDISLYIESLLKDNKYKLEDILLLAPTKKILERVKSTLPLNIQKSVCSALETTENKMIFTTFHSSKGIESKVTIAIDIDKIDDRKLLYVASTRASHKLILHSFDFDKSEISQDVKEIAQEKFNCKIDKRENLKSAS